MLGSGFSAEAMLLADVSLIMIASYINMVFEFKKFEFTGGLKLSFEQEELSSRVDDVRTNQGAASVHEM